VNLGPLGSGLEFTDENGASIPATALLTLASSESAAPPSRVYVRRAPVNDLEPVALSVRVRAVDAQGASTFLSTVSADEEPPVIRLESERASRWRHLLASLFTPGPLQWMFTAVAGIVGVWQVYKDFQQRQEERRERTLERRRVQRERIEAIRDAESPERAFRAYMSLRAEFREDDDMLAELGSVFQPAWLPYLRQQLGRYLRAGQFDEAIAWLKEFRGEWRQTVREKTLAANRTLIRVLQDPDLFPSREVLGWILEGFRGVGLEAKEPIVDWLAHAQPSLGSVKDVLFRDGGAGGRYLLLQWAERNEKVAEAFREWEWEAVPVPRRERGSTSLWAKERGESRVERRGVRKLGLDFNPFGPERAEQDPLLPDLFYRLSPMWEEVTAPQPGIFVVPPGCGRSALIWMIRHESGLVGSAVERVLPVFVPLYALSSTEELAQVLQKSVCSALCRSLARDPYGLLGLEEAQREALIELLLRASGGLTGLVRQLHGAGLSPGDADAQLLQEALATVARSRQDWDGVLDWDIPRFHPYGLAHTFFLVDASFRDAETGAMLLEALFDRWWPSLAPRQVVPKVFFSSELDPCPVTPIRVHWDDESLNGLLRHRLERSGMLLQEGQPALDGWIENMQDPDSVLIQKAAGSPAQLIRLGNRLMRRIGQPPLLERDEFLQMMTESPA
jgi:hypothetical protein